MQRLQFLTSMLFLMAWLALLWLTSASALQPKLERVHPGANAGPRWQDFFLGAGLLMLAVMAGFVDAVSRRIFGPPLIRLKAIVKH